MKFKLKIMHTENTPLNITGKHSGGIHLKNKRKVLIFINIGDIINMYIYFSGGEYNGCSRNRKKEAFRLGR